MVLSEMEEARFAALDISCDEVVVLGLMYAGVERRKSEVGYLVRLVTGCAVGNAGPTRISSGMWLMNVTSAGTNCARYFPTSGVPKW